MLPLRCAALRCTDAAVVPLLRPLPVCVPCGSLGHAL